MSLHPEVETFLAAKFPETDVCPMDLLKIGEALLNSLTTTHMLGHANPGSTLDYTARNGVMWHDIVRDTIAWTSGRKHLADGCQERIEHFLTEQSGWVKFRLKQVDKTLELDDTTERVGADSS